MTTDANGGAAFAPSPQLPGRRRKTRGFRAAMMGPPRTERCPLGQRGTMTLVFSTANPEYAIQVADGRLTDGVGGVVNNEFSKTLIVCGTVVLAFTGYSHPEDRLPFDLWVEDQLRNARETDLTRGVTDYLRRRLTAVMAKSTAPDKRYALSLAGWGLPEGTGDFIPFVGRISNFHDETGKWLDVATEAFTENWSDPAGQGGFKYVGQDMTGGELDALQVKLDALGKRESKTPEQFATIFLDEIRRKAVRNKAIGGLVSVVCIPRAAVERGDQRIRSHLGHEQIGAYYLREDGSKTSAVPKLVCPVP